MKLPYLAGRNLRTILMLAIAVSPLQIWADATVSQTGKITGGTTAEYTKKLRVKGLKLRVDSLYGRESHILIYDLEAGKRFRLDAGRKVAFVSNISTSSQQEDRGVIAAKITRAITPTGKQSEINGKSCTEYTFDLRIPHALSSGRSTLERESGTVCVSQSIAEGIELTNFVHEAKKRGYTLAASSWAPTNSVNGVYFYGDEPNVMVLFAKAQTVYEHALTLGLNPLPPIENTMKVTEISAETIPEELF